MRDKSEQTRMAFLFGPTVFSTTSWATWHWFHTSLNIECVYSLMMIINKNQFHSICKKWGVHAELVPGNLRFSRISRVRCPVLIYNTSILSQKQVPVFQEHSKLWHTKCISYNKENLLEQIRILSKSLNWFLDYFSNWV